MIRFRQKDFSFPDKFFIYSKNPKIDVERLMKVSRDGNYMNPALRFYIKGRPNLGCFELVKDIEPNYYSVHFKTGNADTKELYGSTKQQREDLYQAMRDAIPKGSFISTHGRTSDGGVKALAKLCEGWDIVGERTEKDREGRPRKINIYKKLKKYTMKRLINNVGTLRKHFFSDKGDKIKFREKKINLNINI